LKLGSSCTMPPVSVSQTSPGTVRSIAFVTAVRRPNGGNGQDDSLHRDFRSGTVLAKC